jgi:hypothetical protein
MRQVHVFFILALATMGSACDEVQRQFHREKNVCPTQLVAAPHPGGSEIQWFDGNVKANIASLVFECILRRTSNEKTGASLSYELAVTATINYVLEDKSPIYEYPLVFEATTAKGVVLRSTGAVFHLVYGVNSGKVSSRLIGLSPEEIVNVIMESEEQ